MKFKPLVLAFALVSLMAYSACSKQQDATKDAAQNAAQQAENAGGNASAGEAAKVAAGPASTVIPAGTTLTIRLGETISAKNATPGQTFTGTLANAVTVGGKEVIAPGSNVVGEVTKAQAAGKFKGAGVLAVRLTTVEIQGKSYNISTSTVEQAVKGKGKRSLMVGGGGAALGAIIGGLAGGGKGAAIGALAGGGAGTAGAAYTGNKELAFQAERALSFRLKDAVMLN